MPYPLSQSAPALPADESALDDGVSPAHKASAILTAALRHVPLHHVKAHDIRAAAREDACCLKLIWRIDQSRMEKARKERSWKTAQARARREHLLRQSRLTQKENALQVQLLHRLRQVREVAEARRVRQIQMKLGPRYQPTTGSLTASRSLTSSELSANAGEACI